MSLLQRTADVLDGLRNDRLVESDAIQALKQLYGNHSPPDIDAQLETICRAIHSGQGYTSIKDVALYFDVSIATIYNWMNQGVIPKAYKIGGRRRFKNSELLQAEALYEQV